MIRICLNCSTIIMVKEERPDCCVKPGIYKVTDAVARIIKNYFKLSIKFDKLKRECTDDQLIKAGL